MQRQMLRVKCWPTKSTINFIFHFLPDFLARIDESLKIINTLHQLDNNDKEWSNRVNF